MSTPDERDTSDDERDTSDEATAEQPEQAEPSASSDGDGSWTEDPQTQDPDEDRSVEAVVRKTTGG